MSGLHTPEAIAPADILDAIAGDERFAEWWPVDHVYHEAHGTDWRDEVVVGAVLVQNTAWRQVERALAELRAADACDLASLATSPAPRVAELVRSAGFRQRKPVTLQALARLVMQEGGCRLLAESVKDDPDPVRAMLLEVHGVGPETADAILNYALDAPVFVVDAYTRRLMHRLGVQVPAPGGVPVDALVAPYEAVARWWRAGLARDAATYRRAHAAIVTHGQDVCRKLPRCASCALEPRCPHAAGAAAPECDL